MDTAGSAAATGPLASRAYLLFVLTLVGAVGWADRQVVPILFPAIRRDLGLSDTQLGIVGGLAFSLVYATTSFAFGYGADRYIRKYLMAIGLLLWSIATAAGGLATGFWPLFFARFFTGVGEASLYPCALSLIAERFPPELRGRAVGVFSASAAIGGGLGVGLGGSLAQSYGWKTVFFVYGAAGIVCLPILLLLPERLRTVTAAAREPWRLSVKSTLCDRRLLWLWSAGLLAMASAIGFGAWGPSYFVRQVGLDVQQAGALFGLSGLLGGIIGGLSGGALADRRRRARVGGEFDVPAGAGFIAAALIALTIEAPPGPLAVAAGLLGTFVVYAFFPALVSALLSMTPSYRHGVAGALNTLFIGGVGAALGPFVIGVASDATKDLRLALFIPVVGLFVAGLLAIKTGRVVRQEGAGVRG